MAASVGKAVWFHLDGRHEARITAVHASGLVDVEYYDLGLALRATMMPYVTTGGSTAGPYVEEPSLIDLPDMSLLDEARRYKLPGQDEPRLNEPDEDDGA